MKAITSHYIKKRAILMALEAGVNILSSANADYSTVEQTVQWIHESCLDANGQLTQLCRNVRSSLERIRDYKSRL
jgi:hypothetical protein